ncbi:unnamed protein product [Rhizophagus irregularis]|nr:unnamed protein product [Rhizophagus irregularis]
MKDTRKIQIAENKFPMLIMGDENRFLKTTYFQYIQYCESLSASFFKGSSTEVQNNILKANFGLTNEDILSWENRASRYQMTPQSFSFFYMLLCDDQNVNINRSIADVSGSQSHVDQPFDMDITPVEPVSNLDVTMPQPQLLQQPDNNLSNLTKSSNKKKKSNKNIIQQVITGYKPGDDGTSQVRDILVYDIPVSWMPEEILQKLTLELRTGWVGSGN